MTRYSSGTRGSCRAINAVQVDVIDNTSGKGAIHIYDFTHRHGARRIIIGRDGALEVIGWIRRVHDEHGVTCDVGQFRLNGKAYCAIHNRSESHGGRSGGIESVGISSGSCRTSVSSGARRTRHGTGHLKGGGEPCACAHGAVAL